jgi:hypothetical protein
MTKRILCGLVIFGLFSKAQAEDYSGVLFEQNSNQQKKLYTLQVTESSPEGGDSLSVYKDLEGNVVIEEKTQLKGADLVKFEIDHKQLQQKGVIELKEGKAYFTKVMPDGKSSTKDEKVGKTFVVAASFRKFVKANFEDLKAGKTIDFRYGVWDRQETVGFEVFKEKLEKQGDQEVVVLKMKPSSFLIAALVKPIFFKFNADGSRLLEMNGRVAPKKKDGTSWKDLDAEVLYSYP